MACGFLLEEEPGEIHIAGPRDLDIALAAENHADLNLFQTFDEARFIRAREIIPRSRLKRAPQNVVAKNLRGLRKYKPLTRNGRAHFRASGLRPADLLDRVHWNDSDNRCAVQRGFFDHPANRVKIHERPYRIVDCDDIGIRIERRKGFLDGFLPRIAARHHAQRAKQPAPFFTQHLFHPLDFLFAHSNHDIGHHRGCDELASRMHEYGRTLEQHELLAAGARCFGGERSRAARHSSAEAGCRKDDGGFHDRRISGCPRQFLEAVEATISLLPLPVPDAEEARAVPKSRPLRLWPRPSARARRTCRKSSSRRSFAERWSRRCRWFSKSCAARYRPPPSYRRPDTPRPGCIPCLP